MKVLLINGSPNAAGCTDRALREIAGVLREEGLETGFFHIGTDPISGCLDCGACRKVGRCVMDDGVNACAALADEADGMIFGSPVYYASANGALIAFMDRLFFSASGAGIFLRKPAACVVSARRAGTTAALDQMNKYLLISQMIVVGSQYWPMVHGNTPQEVGEDREGLQIMRTLARNMAWMLRCKEAGIAAGLPEPRSEERIATNFIR